MKNKDNPKIIYCRIFSRGLRQKLHFENIGNGNGAIVIYDYSIIKKIMKKSYQWDPFDASYSWKKKKTIRRCRE